jgi:hypothetical protein
VARLARGDHGVGRAARALGVRAARVEPEPERDADRVGPARRSATALSTPPLIATATRSGRRGAEGRADRVRERVDGERLAGHGGRLEQREPARAAREPGASASTIRRRRRQPDERATRRPRGVSDELDHRITVAASPPAHEPLENPANQVGALSAPDASRDRNRNSAPLLRVLVQQSDPQAGAKPDDCS